MAGGRVRCRLVDFGRNIECAAASVLMPAFMTQPAFAFQCRLFGADERPASAIEAVLRQYESRVALVATVRYKLASVYVIDLVDTRDSKDVRITDRLLVATSARVPPQPDIQMNAPESVYISAVSEGVLFAQPTRYICTRNTILARMLHL